MLDQRKRLSLKTRWAIWQARYSTPGLLARMDERKAVSAIAAVNGGLAILAIGLYSWITDLPLVFPGLGPTAFILFAAPRTEAAAPRSVILDHFSGMACGWAVWYLMSTIVGGPVSMQTGGLAPVISASLALAVTCGLLIRLSCPHAPACTSCLIIALGGVTDWLGVLLMAFAVIWITAQAVAMNRLAGVPVPLWSPAVRTDQGGT
jgi:CBS domain-containing membrane protein